MIIFLCFAVHYLTRPLNSLFGSVRGMDEHIISNFKVYSLSSVTEAR